MKLLIDKKSLRSWNGHVLDKDGVAYAKTRLQLCISEVKRKNSLLSLSMAVFLYSKIRRSIAISNKRYQQERAIHEL